MLAVIGVVVDDDADVDVNVDVDVVVVIFLDNNKFYYFVIFGNHSSACAEMSVERIGEGKNALS